VKKIEDYFVPWLKNIKMYISSHIELAWKDKSLARMMSNENPNPPSEKVLAAIANYGKMANRYADQGLVVRAKIAELNGLDGPENVMLGNGSSEVFDMIWRSFLQPGDEVIQHTPCFGIYKLRCAVCGGKLVSVPMKYERGELLFDAEAVIAAVTPKTKMIVIANPNNPTGNFMDAKDFVKIAETGLPFTVDEAYVEYAGLGKSQVQLTRKYENVMITRTLSKAYGLAGMRFGYMLSNKKVVDQIAATLIPWNVSTIAMWAALAAFEDQEALARRVKFNNDQIAYYEKELGSVPGLRILHSYGNYILFDAKDCGKKGADMVEYAQKKGLIIRPQADMYGSDGWFRISIGSEKENRRAVEVIREFCTARVPNAVRA
jgi:histidinol-phosphate aminotransferase